MKTKITMLIPAFIALIGMLGMLTACGGPSITDAASLVDASLKAQSTVENYHMDSDMDMQMKMSMDGMEELIGTESLDMPVRIKTAMDSGKASAHSDMTMSTTFFGQDVDQNTEMYIDLEKGIAYSKAEDTDTWVRSDQDVSVFGMKDGVADLSDETIAKATYTENDDSYQLALDADVMGDTLIDMDLLGSLSQAGMDLKDFSVSGGQVIFTFDKETVLLSRIEMKDVTISAGSETSGTAYGLEIPITADVKLSKYDELDPSSYEIPKSVIDAASGGTKETTPTLPIQNTKPTE